MALSLHSNGTFVFYYDFLMTDDLRHFTTVDEF